MKKGLPVFLLFLLLSLCCSPLPCQEINSKYTRSVYTENYLRNREFNVRKNEMVPPFIGKFPYNLTIEIPAQDRPELNLKKQPAIKTVIFAFTQDFFVSNPEFICQVIENTTASQLPYNCTILISADDEKFILEDDNSTPCPSEYYANSLYETDSTCAFVIYDEEYYPSKIDSIGEGQISPMWIVRSIEHAFIKNQKTISVQNGILYNYKRSLFKENRRLGAFKKNEIVSAAFPLGHETKDLNILDSLQEELIEQRNSSENRHYNQISIGTLSLWINEPLLTLIYITFAVIVLISLCFSSFKDSGKNNAVLKDLSRTWFLFPAYIFLCTILFTVSQNIFIPLQNSLSLYFCLKTGFTILVLFALSYLQIFFKLRISLSAISFLNIILCAVNIFIFAFLDLSLMFVFILEYMIVFFSEKSNSKIITLLSLALMIIPLLQPATNLYMNTDHSLYGDFIHAGIRGNLFFSLLLVPFVFQWIRCALILNISNRLSFHSKIFSIISGIIASTLAGTIMFLTFTFATGFISKNFSKEKQENKILISESREEIVKVEHTTSDNFGLINHRLRLISPDGKKIARCCVELSSPFSIPLYESNFNYNFKTQNEVELEIPDGAEESLLILFSTDYTIPVHVKIDIYINEDEMKAIHQTWQTDLDGKNASIGKEA